MNVIKRVSCNFRTFICLINAHQWTKEILKWFNRRSASIKVLKLESGHLLITYNRIKANGFPLNVGCKFNFGPDWKNSLSHMRVGRPNAVCTSQCKLHV